MKIKIKKHRYYDALIILVITYIIYCMYLQTQLYVYVNNTNLESIKTIKIEFFNYFFLKLSITLTSYKYVFIYLLIIFFILFNVLNVIKSLNSFNLFFSRVKTSCILIFVLVSCIQFFLYKNFNNFIYEINNITSSLNNSLILVHPPLILISYYLILFSFAVLMQKHKKYNNDYIFNNFLTGLNNIILIILITSILLGAFWAYSELGWGGWWFWDKIELISLTNLIILIIYIHLLIYLININLNDLNSYLFIYLLSIPIHLYLYTLNFKSIDSVHAFGTTFIINEFLLNIIYCIYTLNLFYHCFFLFEKQKYRNNDKSKIFKFLFFNLILLIFLLFFINISNLLTINYKLILIIFLFTLFYFFLKKKKKTILLNKNIFHCFVIFFFFYIVIYYYIFFQKHYNLDLTINNLNFLHVLKYNNQIFNHISFELTNSIINLKNESLYKLNFVKELCFCNSLNELYKTNICLSNLYIDSYSYVLTTFFLKKIGLDFSYLFTLNLLKYLLISIILYSVYSIYTKKYQRY